MARTLRLLLASIALVAHVGSAPSLLAAADPSALDQQAEQRDCCSPEGETPDREAPEEPGDCCPDGCQHCPLSCCGGSPAVTGTVLEGLAGYAASQARFSPACARLPATDPREIYHPPRI